jgi:hypothetical protein
MGRGVGVAADDGHARLGEPQFRTDDVHDSLLRRVQIEQPDPEVARVLDQRVHLMGRQLIGDGKPAISSGNVVIDRCHSELGPANPPARQA